MVDNVMSMLSEMLRYHRDRPCSRGSRGLEDLELKIVQV